MPIGIIVDVLCVLFGGLFGDAVGHKLSDTLKESLVNTFGFCALAIGIVLTVRIDNLGPVVLAMILGVLVGELLQLDQRVNAGISAVSLRVLGDAHGEDYLREFCAVAVLFSCSGTGLVGSMEEGFSGDHSILIAKAVMDLFTAVIFAALLGKLVAFISAPQAVIMLAMFALSHLLLPLFSAPMLANFSAAGGLVTMMAGFNMLKLSRIRVINVLPALIFAPVFTAYWPL